MKFILAFLAILASAVFAEFVDLFLPANMSRIADRGHCRETDHPKPTEVFDEPGPEFEAQAW